MNVDSLNPEELEVLIQLLSSDDSNQLIEQVYSIDYEELPVDFYTFITDPDYLGNSLIDSEGNLLLYDYWVKTLSKIFAPDSSYFEIALSGAIGIGKSTVAVIGMAYILYKLLCLKDPSAYYRLTKGSIIALAFFNINLNQSYGVGFAKFQNLLQSSPWFLRHGTCSGRGDHKTYYPDKNIEIIVGSTTDHFIGRDVFAAFLDEMEFARGQNPKMELSGIMKIYTAVLRRMESRFAMMGSLPGKLFLVSSKKSSNDFLEQYIKKNKGLPHLYVVDEPIWVVKDREGMYCGKTFNVAIGNNYNKSKILDDNDNPQDYVSGGQEVIAVPIEYRRAFTLDLNQAIMDIAGKSLSSGVKFIDIDKLKLCYRGFLRNPFTMEEITLDFDDDSQLKDFLILKYLPPKNKPYFIHWDPSVTGDGTGLAMSTVIGSKSVRKLRKGQVYEEEDIIHKLAFAIKIRPTKGKEIPYYKIRSFIYYLTYELGFNIISITADSYQSVDTLQQFKLRKFHTRTLSVDRSTAPYETLKNAINEERLIMPKIELLETELVNLEYDSVRGKVDHPIDGCLPPRTELITNNGKVQIANLSDTDKVLTYADNGDFEFVPFKNLRITKEVTSLISLNVGDDRSFKCTHNHKILTTEGYIRADCLNLSHKIITRSLEGQVIEEKLQYIAEVELTGLTKVYDIEVPVTNNFVLANGVVVHNSKDIADSLCGSVYESLELPEIIKEVQDVNIASGSYMPSRLQSGSIDDILNF